MGAVRLDTPLMRTIDRRGLKRSHVAGVLGITPYALSRIERGQQRAPSDFYRRAALLLGVDVADVVPEPKEVQQAA